MIRKIVQIGDAVLTKLSEEVQFPLSKNDKNIITDLMDTAIKVGDKAAGLSAPQIGINKRIAICRRLDIEELLIKLNDEKYISTDLNIIEVVEKLITHNNILLSSDVKKAVELLGLKQNDNRLKKKELYTFLKKADDLLWLTIINPAITYENDYETIYWEGCLSVGTGKNALYAPVARSEIIEFDYYDIHGKKIKMKTSNYFAHAILHELDHLNGVLFISRVENIKNIWKSEDLDEFIKKNKKYPEIIQ